jgi:hypothetical protein
LAYLGNPGLQDRSPSFAKLALVTTLVVLGSLLFYLPFSGAMAQPLLQVDSSPTPQPVLCEGSLPTITGATSTDVIIGTDSVDVIHSLDGNDIIRGLDGDDVICGGEGNDLVLGNEGDDVVNGGEGADHLLGGPGDDSLNGGADSEVCEDSEGSNTLSACETIVPLPPTPTPTPSPTPSPPTSGVIVRGADLTVLGAEEPSANLPSEPSQRLILQGVPEFTSIAVTPPDEDPILSPRVVFRGVPNLWEISISPLPPDLTDSLRGHLKIRKGQPSASSWYE